MLALQGVLRGAFSHDVLSVVEGYAAQDFTGLSRARGELLWVRSEHVRVVEQPDLLFCLESGRIRFASRLLYLGRSGQVTVPRLRGH